MQLCGMPTERHAVHPPALAPYDWAVVARHLAVRAAPIERQPVNPRPPKRASARARTSARCRRYACGLGHPRRTPGDTCPRGAGSGQLGPAAHLQMPHESSSAFHVHVDTACHSSISTFIAGEASPPRTGPHANPTAVQPTFGALRAGELRSAPRQTRRKPAQPLSYGYFSASRFRREFSTTRFVSGAG